MWHVADVPPNDKFQFTHFAHKINSFNTAPKKLLASDSRLRPDRWALEKGDLSKAGAAKSRSISIPFSYYNLLAYSMHALAFVIINQLHLFSLCVVFPGIKIVIAFINCLLPVLSVELLEYQS